MVKRVRAGASSLQKIRTGIALSPTELCAADVRLRGSAERVWRAPLDPPSLDGGAWPSLASAFAELARALDTTQGIAAVALLQPLIEVRRLDLPPLRDGELTRVLTRNAQRYFVNARGPQLVGASRVVSRSKAETQPIVAAAASARLVAVIRAAAEQSGWTIDTMQPAEGAWAAAASSLWPAFAKQSAWMVVANDDRTELLQIDAGRLVGVRRFRGSAADAAIIVDTVGARARLGVVGSATQRRELLASFGASGLAPATAVGEWANANDRPDVLAAHFAGSDAGPVLRADEAIAQDRVRTTRLAWTMTAAAAALIVVAAGLELWGVHRQLRIVQAERTALRPQIASTLVGRTTVEATYRNLITLGEIERSSPRWSAVIAALSDAVPDEAHLTAIRAREDSLIVDGLAEHAARVFDALNQTSLLTDVKAPAPVRRELQPDGKALDHFTISARVTQPPAAPAAAAHVGAEQ
ncbi:MAG TPA: PilN domain-containing protein [Gemmatimonadaceae bacterium]|jgi:hypothetical protein